MKAVARALLAILLSVSLHALAAQQAAPDLAQAQALMRDGRAAEAYDLLAPFEATFAGEAEFDYWLGVSALEAGKPDRASLALERALIVNPDFVAARLDLARAYFALGDFDRARTEFRAVREQDPPPAARATIDRYLEEIDQRGRGRRLAWTAYLEGTLGRDSNINTATSNALVFVPIFSVDLLLDPDSIKRSDNYFSIGGGGEIVMPLVADFSLYAGLDVRRRTHFDEDVFDFDRHDSRLGIQFARGRDNVRAGVGYGRLYLDRRYHYENTGMLVEWRRALSDRNVATLVALQNRLRYPDITLKGNNADQTIFGAGLGHSFDASGTSFVFGSLYGGKERDTDNRIDGDRQLIGARLIAQHGIAPQWDAYVSLLGQWSDYDTENSVFQATRKDKYYELAIGAIWRLQRDMTLRPQVAYSRNDSKITIYDYDRYDFSITLRRDFR